MRKRILPILMICLLFTGCVQEPGDRVRQPITVPLPEAEAGGSSEPTGLTVDSDYQVRRMPEAITVYPFPEEEMTEAREVVDALLEELSGEIGTREYRVERIAYDPIMTDVKVRQEIGNAPVPGWEEMDYYINRISFVVTYSAEYDHTATYLSDAAHETFGVHLRRTDADAPWEYYSHGLPVEAFFDKCLTFEELAALPTEETVLAGYLAGGQDYWIYLYREETGQIRLEWLGRGTVVPEAVWDESEYQQGQPITPQPGDTSSTYSPDRAAEYPSDGDCGDMELLEKWMAAEGVTWLDLEQRQCNQLLLVAAQEDGVSTVAVCYERLDGGGWAPAQGMERMTGWVGSGGVMHDRRRNTNTSPAGLWSLGTAFGNEARPEGLNIPWRDVTPNSQWVCDENSVYFNSWQEWGDPTLEETWSDDVEILSEYETQYAYACVIRYNTPPYTVPERGCAIFLHCSTGPTGGCVGLRQKDMIRVLQWLSEGKHPHILITGNAAA